MSAFGLLRSSAAIPGPAQVPRRRGVQVFIWIRATITVTVEYSFVILSLPHTTLSLVCCFENCRSHQGVRSPGTIDFSESDSFMWVWGQRRGDSSHAEVVRRVFSEFRAWAWTSLAGRMVSRSCNGT